MARRRYRRYYRRKSGKWAPNIVKIASTNSATPGEFYNAETLAINPVQTNTGVSQAFTCKNFEITFSLETETTNTTAWLESVTAYIMYVPQGMNVTSAYYAEHPEYIMAYKYLGSPLYDATNQGQQFQPFKIRTRLSRKLQTGDSIILYIQGSNENTNSTPYNIDGVVRWWSKAN